MNFPKKSGVTNVFLLKESNYAPYKGLATFNGRGLAALATENYAGIILHSSGVGDARSRGMTFAHEMGHNVKKHIQNGTEQALQNIKQEAER